MRDVRILPRHFHYIIDVMTLVIVDPAWAITRDIANLEPRRGHGPDSCCVRRLRRVTLALELGIVTLGVSKKTWNLPALALGLFTDNLFCSANALYELLR